MTDLQAMINVSPSSVRRTIPSVVLIHATATNRKGTGWIVSDSHIVTNQHVISGCRKNFLRISFCDGIYEYPFSGFYDEWTDLAVLEVPSVHGFPPLAIDPSPLPIGCPVWIWGHPLGYNGPYPILTVGHVAGSNAHVPDQNVLQQRLVINAALNNGNSGGPLTAAGECTVRGVVVSKHAPITPYLLSAIAALSAQQDGFVYTATDTHGQLISLSEAKVVADVLQHFRDMTQVVIGEAIAPEDLIGFLDNNSIPWTGAISPKPFPNAGQ